MYLVKVENEIAYYFNNNKNQSSEYKHYTIYVYIIDVANLDLKEKYIYYNWILELVIPVSALWSGENEHFD